MKSRLPVAGCCLLTTLLIGIWLGQTMSVEREIDEEIVDRSTVSPFNSDGWQLASGQDSGPAATLRVESPFDRHSFANHPAYNPLRSETTVPAETPIGPDVAYFPEVITETAGVTSTRSAATVEEAHSEDSLSPTESLSTEDAAVWNAELKDLPANQAAEILALRQQLGSVASESLGFAFPEIPAANKSEPPGLFPELAAGDARPISVVEPSLTDSPVLLVSANDEPPVARKLREEAARIFLESQANQKTIGFKRTQIILLNVLKTEGSSETGSVTSAPESDQPSAIQWITRLDLRPGALTPTANPLDLTIVGLGWLRVERDDRHEFVKTGMLGFNDDGRLGIHTGAGLLPIVPAVKLAVEQQRIVISDSGEIYSVVGGEQKRVGQLSAFDFRDASALKRTTSGTYVATDASGPAIEPLPGFVTFQPAVLEESNVDIEADFADTMRLKAIAGQIAKQP